MDIGYHKFENKYDIYNSSSVITYKLKIPNRKAELAIELMGRIGMATGIEDGEDSTGRSKIKLLPSADVVKRAIEIADMAIDEMDKRGWYLEIPEPKFELDK